MLKKKVIPLAIAAAISTFAASSAISGPAWEFTTASNTFTNGSWDFGTWFKANSDLSVTGLGYYADPVTTQANNNQVGLFNSTGTLLASATVDNTYALFGHFRYVTIAPLALTAGESYLLVGVSQSNNYTWDNAGFATDPLISYLGNTWDLDTDNTPTFVSSYQNDTTDGYWGPNLFINSREFTGQVPEPATLLLLGVAIAALGVSRRMKRM